MEIQYSYNFRRYMINIYTKFRHEKVLRKNTKSGLLNLMVILCGKKIGWTVYTKCRKIRLWWDVVKKYLWIYRAKEQMDKLDFIEYKHRSYPRYEQAIRDEIWENRF